MFAKVAPFFDLPENQPADQWSDQQRLNIERMLEILRILVSPDNPPVCFAFFLAQPCSPSHTHTHSLSSF